MEESIPPSSLSKSVLVIGFVALLVKGGECGELVLPSLSPLVRRTEEREELVCGTELTGGQSSPAGAVSVESEGGEWQGMAAPPAWQGRRQCLLRASLGGGHGRGAKDSANTRKWTDLNVL